MLRETPLYLAALLSYAAGSHASEAVRIVVVRDAAGIVSNRLGAEAAAVGMVVVEVPSPAGESADLARTHDARAVLRPVQGGSIEIWIEGAAGHPPVDEVVAMPERDEGAPLRAVERLRAHFVKLGIAVDPAPIPPPAPSGAPDHVEPRPARAPEAASPPWLGVELGTLGVVAEGGLGASLSGTMGVRLDSGGWGGALFVALPLSELETEGEGADASARGHVTMVGVRGLHRFGDTSALVPELGASLSVAALSLDGEAEPPLVSHHDTLVCGVGTLDAALSMSLGQGVRVRLLAGFGLAMPRPTVRFEGKEAATWGRALGLAALTVDVDFSRLVGAREGSAR